MKAFYLLGYNRNGYIFYLIVWMPENLSEKNKTSNISINVKWDQMEFFFKLYENITMHVESNLLSPPKSINKISFISQSSIHV